MLFASKNTFTYVFNKINALHVFKIFENQCHIQEKAELFDLKVGYDDSYTIH